MKHATNVRLTEEAIRLLDKLAHDLGVSKTAIIELAVRELAKKNATPLPGSVGGWKWDGVALRPVAKKTSARRNK